MSELSIPRVAAFAGHRRIASGPLTKVALKIKQAAESGKRAPCLTFDDETGEQVEVDLRGSAQEFVARIQESTRTHPKVANRRARSNAART